MSSEEPTVRITAEEEIQAPLSQLPPDKALRATSPRVVGGVYETLGQYSRPLESKAET
jgi:hypothetical protein